MRTRFSINLHVHSSRYTCIWPVALALISLGLADVTNALAQENNSPRAVSALGRLEPEYGTVHLSAHSTFEDVTWAVLATSLVKEGDDVTRGQLLATVGSTQVVQAKVTEADAELNFRLREAEATRSTTQEACVRADVALREADRRARLHAQGVAGEEEADSAAGEAEARAASCNAARTAVQAADARIELARASLMRSEAEYERTKLYAPIDGRVLEINTKPGERIDLEGVLELGNVNRMYAIAEIYETDIRHIRVGQKATVSSAALEKPLSGSVKLLRQKVEKQDEIGTDPAARKDARIIEVKILLDDSAQAASLTNLQVDVVIQL